MKLQIQDFSLPIVCMFLSYVFLTTKQLVPRSDYDLLGNLMIMFAFLFIGLTLFENLTKCKECRLYNNHTLSECFHERLFVRNDRHE